jgi:hypothetical protein
VRERDTWDRLKLVSWCVGRERRKDTRGLVGRPRKAGLPRPFNHESTELRVRSTKQTVADNAKMDPMQCRNSAGQGDGVMGHNARHRREVEHPFCGGGRLKESCGS